MPMGFRIRHVTVPLLPVGIRPIKVLHFSDIHLHPRQSKAINFIRSWRDLNPDLVISTGDHISHPSSIGLLVDALGPLLKKPGCFVFGSNDYFGPRFKNPARYLLPDQGKRVLGSALPSQLLSDSLSNEGWLNLTQKKLVTNIGDISVELRGTDDAHLQRDKYEEIAGKRAETDLSLGVTHAPYRRILEAMAQDRVDLILAGHTHGGQIRVPWFHGTTSLTTNCDLPNWRSRGLTRVDGEPWLHVSAGIGHNPLTPFRMLSPREVSLLELTSHS